jgi:hypothetical protein
MHFFGDDVHEIGGDEGDRGCDAGGFGPESQDEIEYVSDGEADEYAHDGEDEEFGGGFLEDELACEDGGGSESEYGEGGCVIDEAFSFEYGDTSAGHAHAFEDGGCGDGVGRGDDTAEEESERECEAGDDGGGEPGDGGGGREYEAESEDEDGAFPFPELVPGGGPCGFEEEGREEDEEYEIGVDIDAGHLWDKADQESSQDEKYGIRDLDALAKNIEHCHYEEQCEDQQEGMMYQYARI